MAVWCQAVGCGGVGGVGRVPAVEGRQHHALEVVQEVLQGGQHAGGGGAAAPLLRGVQARQQVCKRGVGKGEGHAGRGRLLGQVQEAAARALHIQRPCARDSAWVCVFVCVAGGDGVRGRQAGSGGRNWPVAADQVAPATSFRQRQPTVSLRGPAHSPAARQNRRAHAAGRGPRLSSRGAGGQACRGPPVRTLQLLGQPLLQPLSKLQALVVAPHIVVHHGAQHLQGQAAADVAALRRLEVFHGGNRSLRESAGGSPGR
jgi:hypothetical protein